jgi:CDP-diacylglycerol pyrophosphatase
MHPRIGQAAATVVLGVAALLTAGPPARAADPDALWKIVHGRCVPDQQTNNDPKPCAAVDLAGGYALLKDIVGASQFLLIPTEKITGIESPQLLAPDAPNYVAAAWAARSAVDAALHHTLPRDDIGLAINSESARSQNQLHIHIDCLSVPVIEALHSHLGEIGETWSALPVPLAGHTYMARRLDDAALAKANPFRLLADGVPGAAADMGHQTLALAGATFPDGRTGVVLLADHVNRLAGDFGGSENLQDHACAVANSTD